MACPCQPISLRRFSRGQSTQQTLAAAAPAGPEPVDSYGGTGMDGTQPGIKHKAIPYITGPSKYFEYVVDLDDEFISEHFISRFTVLSH